MLFNHNCRTHEDRYGEPVFSINLRGCELTPDVNLAHAKYGIKLEVPNSEGMTEYWLRFDSEDQYTRWLAAFKLASKGRTMGDPSYEAEVKQIQEFLSMQVCVHNFLCLFELTNYLNSIQHRCQRSQLIKSISMLTIMWRQDMREN